MRIYYNVKKNGHRKRYIKLAMKLLTKQMLNTRSAN